VFNNFQKLERGNNMLLPESIKVSTREGEVRFLVHIFIRFGYVKGVQLKYQAPNFCEFDEVKDIAFF
jgi:hypothetical protein